ncbi:MAG: hypothetical protein E4H14_05405 [Candidatus Thorarchaeota archaeon]|nr:MAG: hypothetical protein E4H14_05405 [Candidatus Thorarchaeota archaeon]
MVIDEKSISNDDLKTQLYETVAVRKVSSLEMISDLTGLDEILIREAIEELVDEGSLEGTFAADGKRFFLSDVRISAAPIAAARDAGLEIKKVDTKNAKYVGIIGAVMLIFGQILRSLVAIHPGMDNAGTAFFMLGLVVLIVGWFQYSRLEPPTNIRV